MAKSQYPIGSKVEVIAKNLKDYPEGMHGLVIDDNFTGSSNACRVKWENGFTEWFYDGYVKLVKESETKEKFYPSYI